MLFNSYTFLLGFLPIALAGFFLLARLGQSAQATWLVASSLFFYGWWDIRFLPILLVSACWNFAAATLLQRLNFHQRRRSVDIVLATAIAGDLAVLGYFKYAGFFAKTADQLVGTQFGSLDIILPLGVSFFTFTQIAFLVDAARGLAREVDPIRYLLFVTYFPHLIAGPILHHKEIIPQFAEGATYKISTSNMAIGIAYLAIGLAKKCLLADSFAADANGVFNAPDSAVIATAAAWRGAIAYTLQLYFDFSGYIDMAVGISLMFNVRLPLNFNSPYKALSIIDFWRQWHMTLSRFLRDYLYIPLGGNRRGPWRRHVNIFITMLLGGFWHGASWTFIAWGALHGLFIGVNHAWRAIKPSSALQAVPLPLREAAALALTFLCVVVAWVFFRAPELGKALHILAAMAGADRIALPQAMPVGGELDAWLRIVEWGRHLLWLPDVLLYAAGLVIVFAMPNSQQLIEPERFPRRGSAALPVLPIEWRPTPVWAIVCCCLVVASLLTLTHVSEFLYFQF
jgi:D-alanyl-lipoteichoic acid acyltransferase DltB (MBOAT superfamily)